MFPCPQCTGEQLRHIYFPEKMGSGLNWLLRSAKSLFLGPWKSYDEGPLRLPPVLIGS